MLAQFSNTCLLFFILTCLLFGNIKCQYSGETDVCKTNPCANKGICVQTINTKTGFKCQCYGTGYYGERCIKECPKSSAMRGAGRRQAFPLECIVI